MDTQAPENPPATSLQPKNKLANAALVFAIIGTLGMIFGIGMFFAIPAIIYGHISLAKIKKAGGSLPGYGASVASVILGYISGVLGFFCLAGILIATIQALPPRPIRQEISKLAHLQPPQRYEAVLSKLSQGKQVEAEQLLAGLVRKYPDDQYLAFAQAVCSRSRWSKSRASQQFYSVEQMNPATLPGRCARYTIAFDQKDNIHENLAGLFLLADQNPKDPMILWLAAVECRDYFRFTGKTTYSKRAEIYYRRLLELFEVGPSMVHHTFANVLAEEIDLDEEALKHRYIAVYLEPASWTYQGLANTLSALKKYPEANEAYAKLIEMDPYDANYWNGWANSLSHQQRYSESIEKCKKVLEINKGHYKANNTWGFGLEMKGQLPEALQKYEQTILMNPIDPYAYDAAARVLTKMGRQTEAQIFLNKKQQLPASMSGKAGF